MRRPLRALCWVSCWASVAGFAAVAAGPAAGGWTTASSNLLRNPSFEQGFAGWSDSPGQQEAIESGGRQGHHYLSSTSPALSSSDPNGVGTVSQEAPFTGSANDLVQGTVLLRAPATGRPGDPGMGTAELYVWTTGGTPNWASANVTFGPAWERFGVGVRLQGAGVDQVGFAIVLTQPDETAQIDGASLRDYGSVPRCTTQQLAISFPKGWAGLGTAHNVVIFRNTSANCDASGFPLITFLDSQRQALATATNVPVSPGEVVIPDQHTGSATLTQPQSPCTGAGEHPPTSSYAQVTAPATWPNSTTVPFTSSVCEPRIGPMVFGDSTYGR